MEATKVRDLSSSGSGARQVLYRLMPALPLFDLDDRQVGLTDYVVVSAAVVPYTGPETYIFPADSEGNITDRGELPGSYRGGLDHDEAIRGLLSKGGRW